MRIADLGDRAVPPLLAGGMLGRDEPDEGHQLLGALEAAEVAELGDKRERGQRVDAAQAAQAAGPGRAVPGGPARAAIAPRARVNTTGGRTSARPAAGALASACLERQPAGSAPVAPAPPPGGKSGPCQSGSGSRARTS